MQNQNILDTLEQESRQYSEMLAWSEEILTEKSSSSQLWTKIPEGFVKIFSVSNACSLILHGQGLVLKKAFAGSSVKPWTMPSRKLAWLQEEGFRRLTLGACSQNENYFFLPLERHEFKAGKWSAERLPLGMLVVVAQNGDENAKQLWLQFAHLASLHLSRDLWQQELRAEAKSLTASLRSLQSEVEIKPDKLKLPNREIVGGKAPAMAQVFRYLEQISSLTQTLLMVGESGTGKRLVARALHLHGPFSAQNFVVVNCHSLRPQVIENQLFASTGFFRQASGSTLFLEDVDRLKPELQTQILSALGEGHKANLRVIAATPHHLENLVQKGMFDKDLLYRLSIFSLSLPPLRERREDIPILAEHFLRRICRTFDRPTKRLTAPALLALTQAPWPGNVRELENTLEKVVSLTSGKRIDLKHLPQDLRGNTRKNPLSLAEAKANFLKSYIETLMQKTEGQINEAAKRSGVHRTTLYRLTVKYSSTPKQRKVSK